MLHLHIFCGFLEVFLETIADNLWTAWDVFCNIFYPNFTDLLQTYPVWNFQAFSPLIFYAFSAPNFQAFSVLNCQVFSALNFQAFSSMTFCDRVADILYHSYVAGEIAPKKSTQADKPSKRHLALRNRKIHRKSPNAATPKWWWGS